ncbi:MAG: hypothetical protein M1530_01980 [Candidatus Marsarchaeota archaeon]|nr:hypothetical protein [Candidatus Marsarchaeota archaeon]
MKKAYRVISDYESGFWVLKLGYALAFFLAVIAIWWQRLDPVASLVAIIMSSVFIWAVEMSIVFTAIGVGKFCKIPVADLWYNKLFESTNPTLEDKALYEAYIIHGGFHNNMDINEKFVIRNELQKLKRAIDSIKDLYSNIKFEEKMTRKMDNISESLGKILVIIQKDGWSDEENDKIGKYLTRLYTALHTERIREEEWALEVEVERPKRLVESLQNRWGAVPNIVKRGVSVVLGLSCAIILAYLINRIVGFSIETSFVGAVAMLAAVVWRRDSKN